MRLKNHGPGYKVTMLPILRNLDPGVGDGRDADRRTGAESWVEALGRA